MGDRTEWVRKKNSNAGPSMLRLASPDGSTINGVPAWGDRETYFHQHPPAASEMPIPLEHVSGVPAFILRKVFSPAECSALVAAIPKQGKGYMSQEEIRNTYRGRIVHRFLSDDEDLSAVVMSRIAPHLPLELDGGRLVGLSPNWRFLHYELGGHQDYHTDGRETEEHAGERVVSRLTCQMYLNDASEFEGGELTFGKATKRSREEWFESIEPCYVHRPEECDNPHRGMLLWCHL